KRDEIEKQATEREAKLAEKFPAVEGASRKENLEKKFAEWLGAQEKKAILWKVLRPAKATAAVPFLTVLDDNSVLASGDMSKRDIYDLTFANVPRGVTALRLEVLPDESLPKRGPGRVFYEGPPGDFFLSELTLTVEGQPVKFGKVTATLGNA